MNNRKLDILFIIYRLFFMFASVYVISRFTSLGDYERYSSAVFSESVKGLLTSPDDTYLTFAIVSGLKGLFLGRMIFANIILNVISSLCILRLVHKIKHGFIFFLLLLSPSFSIWSSYASKEVIIVSLMALMFAEIISFLRDEKTYYIIGFACAALLMFYKLQLVLPIIQLILSIWVIKKYSRHSGIVIIPLLLVINVLGIFIMRDYVDDLVRGIIIHFNTSARSTRDSTFLLKNYGFFVKLPYGMFITFFGPTISEINTSLLHLFTAIESAVIMGVSSVLLVFKGKKFIKPDFINIAVLLNLMLLLLFFQTPWGILNPGSAIRYRSDYYIFILVLIFLYREFFFIVKMGDEHDEN